MVDKIDRKILGILDTEGRLPASQIAKHAHISKGRARYRLRKLNMIINQVSPVLNLYNAGYRQILILLRFQHTTPEIERDIANTITRELNFCTVLGLEGEFDMAVIAYVRDEEEIIHMLGNFRQQFYKYLQAKEIEIVSEHHHFPLHALNKQRKRVICRPETQTELDDVDRSILSVLQEDGRISAINIAKKLNITTRVTLYRLRNLEENIIPKYTINPSHRALNQFTSVLGICLHTPNIAKKIIEHFHTQHSLRDAHICLGKYDLFLKIVTKDMAHFRRLIAGFKERFADKYAFADIHHIVWDSRVMGETDG